MTPKLLTNVLTYMIEGQYYELKPADYIDYIDFYKETYFNNLPFSEKTILVSELKNYLLIILNDSNIDFKEIMFEGAMHAFLEQEDTKKIFELIEKSF